MKKRKEMYTSWWASGILSWSKLVFVFLFQLNSISCLSLYSEGIALLKFKERVMNDQYGALTSWKEVNGEANPCSWFGLGCVGGHVISSYYDYTKDVKPRRILRNGQTSSPKEINSNNNRGTHSSPSNTRYTPNHVSSSPPPPLFKFKFPPTPPHPPSPFFWPLRPPPPPPSQQPPSPGHTLSHKPPTAQRIPSYDVSSPSTGAPVTLILIVVVGVSALIGLILVGFLLSFLRNKTLRKTTTSSGQLQKAFVVGNDRSDGLNSDKPSFIEGIPNIQRSELETACEDFSNVIGTTSIGTIYKGTLSDGIEIAVISLSVTSPKDWSRHLETQFRKKIEVLSKVNHKNFVNLIGYCEEEEPFTRLMVFEYAPNGSLFEHLHVREAEHLDWGMRLRVAMGMAFCLDHMHHLTPPLTHPNLNSSSISLSEDYAAKISDFCFWNEVASSQVQPIVTNTSTTFSVTCESNVFSFGLVLLEMMTGRIPNSLENDDSLDDWVLEYMRGDLPLREMVDPMLRDFDQDQLEKIGDVIRKCLHSEKNRPTIRDVMTRLMDITCINPDKAIPRYSSLSWTEIEARSVNGS